ncbi:MAG: DUF914 domain membrane [Lasallia pustulata]|uniref:DUF914 domain membrane n=1 Tax=Lasallia pustulata TaxID=136370 RepID=A0A5M8PNY5_9LECA|nr:MAG: DUF914 domain membrane [Lasallia pustulata]
MASQPAPFPDPATPAFEVPEFAYPASMTDGDKTARGAAAAVDPSHASPATNSAPGHAAPELVDAHGPAGGDEGAPMMVDEIDGRKGGWFAYVRTRDFYIVLLLGQILALCLTSTNTFTSLLVEKGTSIPAFQTFFNYALLNLVYTSYTIYRYGFKNYGRVLRQDGWKYIILSFLDVEGNYFTVLAYRYTTILSAQLINFFAIVLVVIISFTFLHVRYHPAQVTGILICVGGMGILLASDHITGANGGDISSHNQMKGDLFALAGATFYGMSNVAEEFLVSKRPLYEVVGQLGFWGMLINGTQAGIFDRASFRSASWNGAVGGYLVGYTLCLAIFYSLAPLVFRLASAAFFNISLLTSNFWGVVIGVKVFGLHIHWMYPIAFVCIIGGLVIYFVGKKVLGEARKPWLGTNQERGVSGVGTARRKAERPDVIV